MKRLKLIAACLLVLTIGQTLMGDDYAKKNGFNFVNWATGDDDNDWNINGPHWHLFQRTYIGVRADDLMDVAHWELYKPSIKGEANCFGMCLMSLALLKEDGHLGFCKPACIYRGDLIGPKPFDGPDDPDLDTAIIIMHGHQYGHSMINFLAEKLNTPDYNNPKVAYDDVEYYLSMGDLPIISIVEKPKKGHAMVPYRCEQISNDEWRIYVYDPNRPYETSSKYYDADSNYIKVEKVSGGYDWSFLRDKNRWTSQPTWTGSSQDVESGIFAFPYSLVIQPPRNPFELGAVQDHIFKFFVHGGARISQLKNGEGRRFYKNDPCKDSTSIEIEDDSNLKMANAMILPYFGDADESVPAVYLMKDLSGENFKIDLESNGDGYSFYLAEGGRLIKIEAKPSNAGKDRLEIYNVDSKSEEISIKTQRGSVIFSIDFYREIPAIKGSRSFRVSDSKISNGASMQLRLTENSDSLFIKSENSALACNLKVKQMSEDKTVQLEKNNINIYESVWQSINPTDWNNLEDAELRVER
jgi:hypothetical protein